MQRWSKIYLAIGIGAFAFFCVLATIISVSVASFIRADPTEGLDRKFGNQHLKTTAALIELHKVRDGQYPETLRRSEVHGRMGRPGLAERGIRAKRGPHRLLCRGRARLGEETVARDAPRFLARHGL